MAEVDGTSTAPAEAPAQEENSFGDAFAERAGPTEKQPEADAPKDEQQPAPAAESEQAPAEEQGAKSFDPWDGLSEEQKSFFTSLRHSESSSRGRISALQRQLNEARAAPPAQQQQQREEPKDDTPSRAERLKLAAEEYPDAVAPLVEAIVDLEARLDAAKPQAPATEEAEAPNEAQLEVEYQTLEKAHPDYRQIAQDAKFAEWVGGKSEAIQALSTSYAASDVASVLTLYKAERTAAQPPANTGKPDTNAQRRERQLEGSKAVQPRGAPATSGPASDDFNAAFAARAKARSG